MSNSKPELIFNGFQINAVTERGGDNAVAIRYRQSLNTITKTINSNNVITRLRGRGTNGMTVEGFDATEYTDEQLTGFTWSLTDGKKIITKDYIDSTFISNYARPKEGLKDWSEVEEQKMLFEKMKEYIHEVELPEITYEIEFAELQKQGIPFSDVNLGDWVTIIDETMGVQDKCRVVELSRNPEKMEMSSATLATRRNSIIDYLSALQDTKNAVDSVDRKYYGKYKALEEIIDRTTGILNSPTSKIVFDENALYCFDKTTLGPNDTILNTTKLLKVANGAIGVSKDGGNSYRNAITGEGIHGDKIIGQIIMGQTSLFQNVMVEDKDGDVVVNMGKFTSKIDGTEHYGIQVSSGALEVVGGISTKHVTEDFFAEVEKDIAEVDTALTNFQTNIQNIIFDGNLTEAEANVLKNSFYQLKYESIDIIETATALGITTEKTDYKNKLDTLDTYLTTNWINKTTYPIVISDLQRDEINKKFQDVQYAKTVLQNKIRAVYVDQTAVVKGKLYNGVSITPENGLLTQRSDNNIRTLLNSTYGFAIQKNNSGAWVNQLYADTDGTLTAKNLVATNITINQGVLKDNTGNLLIDLTNRIIDFSKFTTITGKLQANNIETSNLIISAGNIAGQITAGQINIKGINVTDSYGRTTFKVDTYGNVTLGGNITWNSKPDLTAADVGARPNTWVPSYTDLTGTKPDFDADNTFNQLRNNTSIKGFTYQNGALYLDADYIRAGTITGNLIRGGTIQGATLTTGTSGNYVWLAQQYLGFQDGAYTKMSLGFVDTNGNGSQEPYFIMGAGDSHGRCKMIFHKDELYGHIKFLASGTNTPEIRFDLNNNIKFFGNVDFTGCTVSGLAAGGSTVLVLA